MPTNDVKLLGAPASQYVNRVQFALNLKSIDYEFIPQNMREKSELLLKSNPVHKNIPVLLHGDKPICDSLVIVQYIDEFWFDGPSILPSDPYDRAIARFWAAYIDDKWIPFFKELTTAKDEESKTALVEKILEGVKLFEDVFVKASKGKCFFGGETISFLDIVLGCYLGWLKAWGIQLDVNFLDESKTPALVGWAERFSSDKAIHGIIPETEELFRILQIILARAADAASK
nr:glutathione S-transferase U17-like [Coffea arabica]